MEFVQNGIIIGPLYIHYYGLILLSGAIAGTFLAIYLGKKRNIIADTYWDALPICLLAGIIGSRLWHVLTPSASSGINLSYYLQHPLEIFAIWKGGLGIPGAVLGGALGLWFYCRKHKISFPIMADSMIPGVALAQSIGRWGNFVNQELYGKPTDLPWAVVIDPQNRLPEYMEQATYHPLFLYESLYSILNVAFLIWLDSRKTKRLKDGSLVWCYTIFYCFGRFFLEFLRLDPSMVGGLNINQFVMALLISLGIILLVINEKHPAAASAPSKQPKSKQKK